MRLSMLPQIERTVCIRDNINGALGAVKNGDFVVSIAGERQDEAMLAVVRPVIECELRGRMASLDRDLDAYGVTVD